MKYLIKNLIQNKTQVSYNSTIRKKTGLCSECDDGVEKPVIKDLCHTHYWSQIRLKSARKQSVGIDVDPPDFGARKPQKQKIEGLGEWFRERRNEMTGICVETGAKTAKYSDAFFIFSIAHVLPKALFPSVATHPDNWMELSIDAHTKFDRSWDDAARMKCFALAKEKFHKFKHLIAQGERRRIPEQFLT